MDSAVDYLQKKGEKARKAYSNEEAVRSFQGALDILADQTDQEHRKLRLVALEGLGRSYLHTNQEKAGVSCCTPSALHRGSRPYMCCFKCQRLGT